MMVGAIPNENIIYPIIDLIRREVRNFTGLSDDDIPDVTLYRNHPMDEEVLTAVDLDYANGFSEHIVLGLGSEDESTYPEGIKANEIDYYKHFRLTSVSITVFNPSGLVVKEYIIRLNYDNKGLLKGTTVIRG